MLKYLHIENIAVIEHSDIEFTEGFNVLVGETGAGKSIVIDAINAVLGARTSKDLIRTGCDEALVSALFGDFANETVLALKEFDITPDEDANVLIERKLSVSGKGIIKINSKPVTAATLREIAPILVDIHGQHDNQSLLNHEKYVGFIDCMAENEAQRDKYYSEFKNLNSIRKELISLQMDEEEKLRKTDLLEYQIKELEEADIKVGEYSDLKSKLLLAENIEATLLALNNASHLLSGDDNADGALTLVNNAAKQLVRVKDNKISELGAKLNETASSLMDISAEISSLLDDNSLFELNPNIINKRLDRLNKLMLKYGSNEEKMLEFLTAAKAELKNIQFSDKRTAELEILLDSSTERLISLGETLTNSRKIAADKFSKNVSDRLAYMNMPSVKFNATVTKTKYTKCGCDDIEFLISANAGETPKPLYKTASGGELSRIMLAIKSTLLDKDTVGTMIFDEIDSGISGFAADKVAAQLKKVSLGRQVICITHLAQIAARADNHLLISKTTDNGRTYTKVEPLSYEGRIKEIARIMSGTDITENLYNSAKELLDRSLKDENL